METFLYENIDTALKFACLQVAIEATVGLGWFATDAIKKCIDVTDVIVGGNCFHDPINVNDVMVGHAIRELCGIAWAFVVYRDFANLSESACGQGS